MNIFSHSPPEEFTPPMNLKPNEESSSKARFTSQDVTNVLRESKLAILQDQKRIDELQKHLNETQQQLGELQEKYRDKCEQYNWFHDLYLESQRQLASEKLVSEGLREQMSLGVSHPTQGQYIPESLRPKGEYVQTREEMICDELDVMPDWHAMFLDAERLHEKELSSLTRDIQRKDEALEECKKYLWTNGVHRPFESIVKLIQSALAATTEEASHE